MDYDCFRAVWNNALLESRLPTIGLHASETLDTRTLDRSHTVYVEPLGCQDARAFHVSATLSWSWHALHTARATTRDDDVLTEMLGRDGAEGLETEKPYIRVDIKLTARAPYGQPLPMPSKAAWANWAPETMGRLETTEPLAPNPDTRVNRMGMLEILAWKEQPKVTAVCAPTGDLLLEAVEISAGQIVELPRVRDGSDETPDSGPDDELAELFSRVRASLTAWMQAVDQLRPRDSASR
ncbi:MAG: hypothetical protein ACOY0T_03010 [Myxococcota bacterium]